MKLETAQRIGSEDVSEEELNSAFQDDQGRGEFIILSQSDDAYIQAAGESDDPYTLEYRDGGQQYQCVKEVSKEAVQSVFLKYLKGDSSWKSDFEWKQLEEKPWWKFW